MQLNLLKIAVLSLYLLLISVRSDAQVLRRIKERATDKARDEANQAKNDARYKARQAAYRELDEFRSEFDSTDIDYAILLSDNSGLFSGKGRHETGVKFMRLGAIANSLYRDGDLTDEENARLNLHMGQSAYATGRFVYAEKRLTTAQRYFEQAYMTSDLGYLKALSSQGLLYASMGRYAQAEKYTLKSLDLRERQLGTTNMAVAASRNNYAVLQFNLGRYNEAEKEFETAASIIKANRQEASMSYAILLNNQAMLNQSLGRYEQAVTLLKQALQLVNNRESAKSRNHLKFFSNLALLYQQMGKYPEAEEIYRGLEKRLERGKPEFAHLLNNVAILAMLMKREDRVEDMLKQSAGIYRSSMGERNPAYAKVISDLGNYYRYKGRYEEAGPLLQQALEIRQETLGELHPLYVQSQEDQAILHWKKKETAAAGNLYRKVLEQTLDFINRYFPPMSEAEKTRYWDLLAPRFERAYQFAIEIAPTDPSWLTDVLEYRMATKGLLLRSSRRITQSILGSGDTKLIQEYDQWLDNKEQLTALYAYSKEDLREQGINLDSLVDATNAMEKRLSEHSRDFAQFVFATRVRAAAVQQSLKADEALVEIIRYRHFDQVLTDSAGYAALILTKSTAVPKLVILPAGTELEGKAAKAYRLLMKNKAKDEQSYGSYWSPLEPELSGKKTLYVSPDGIYNQINLNTLRKPGGDFLINTYNIVLVGNPRDVTGTRSSAAPGNMPKTATLIGFPDYGSGLLVELPGTKVEVAAINKLLRSSGFSVSEWLQQDATETNLKRSHQVAILHIATHGYFLKDVERTNWPIGVAVDNARENVLLRSGLMLTGAAQAEKGAVSLDSSNNGIMTSYEAMNLDLQGTGLVVLSACETGLGDIKAGEGVYGLQRAFLAAGAQAVVMSLWKVDDNATQQLMNLFYANWVKGGNRQKAFRQAQQQLMTQFPEPLYWGAFILIEY